MRMQNAIALDDYREEVSGFGDRESRRARRRARRDRRQQRREDRREERQEKKSDRKERRADRRDDRRGQRQERRLDRVQRRKAKVRDKLSQVPGPAPRRPLVRRPAPTLQPAPTSRSQLQPPAQDAGWPEEAWDAAEEMLDPELEPDGEYEEEPEEGYEDEGYEDEGDEQDATEGIGAWRPFRRGGAPARRKAPVATPAEAGAWGPSVRMGRRLRIHSAAGHRAAVIDLKPGLYLVAELPEAVTRTEFGLAPLLAPLMITAARRAMDDPPRERRGPLAALFRRRREEPVRYIEVQPAPAPPALPGPVATEPAPVVVPAPNVGWADDATVAAVYGCDHPDRCRR